MKPPARAVLTGLAFVALNAFSQPTPPPRGPGDDAPSSGQEVEIDLGTPSTGSLSPSAGPLGVSTSASKEPGPRRGSTVERAKSQRPTLEAGPRGTEHVEFKRRPIRVLLATGQERLITFPGPVALHVPANAQGQIRLETIGRTTYATALSPFSGIRIVAEDLHGDGQQYPLDLVAEQGARVPADEVEIHSPKATPDSAQEPGVSAAPPIDMVALTRYAARMLYAPRRLIPATPGVRQVPVKVAPVPDLYRGGQVQTTPMGSWRAGALYVTAVRFTNLGYQPVDIDLDEVRGSWLSATAQHGRLGPAGRETDTTAVYLVSDKPFEASR